MVHVLQTFILHLCIEQLSPLQLSLRHVQDGRHPLPALLQSEHRRTDQLRAGLTGKGDGGRLGRGGRGVISAFSAINFLC